MADNATSILQTYPLQTYRFRVKVGDEEMRFSQVSGMKIEFDTVTYKDGAGGVARIPGQLKEQNITLKRGVVKKLSALYDWVQSVSASLVEKKDILISLTDNTGTELYVTWTISNAFPVSLTFPDFDASSSDVAIEELQLMADEVHVKWH